jgi:non-specific serine/threonine protein kinase
LKVRYVVEGSVRKAGNNLRITAQLIDAAGDEHLWAEKYLGTLDDIFDMQERVSCAIVGALKLTLTAAEARTIEKRALPNAQAYECYLRAQTALHRMTQEGFEEAVRLLQASLSIVGENALLYAGLGYAHMLSADLNMKSMDAIANAEKYARKALDLDPGISQAQMVLGYVQIMHGNPRECIRQCKLAISTNPNDNDARLPLGLSLCCVGRTAEVFSLAQRMIESDPLNPAGYWIRALGHFYEGRFADACDALRREPVGACNGVPLYRFMLAYFLAYSGRVEEALSLIEPIEEIETSDFMLRCHALLRFALQGNRRSVMERITGDIAAGASIDCYKATILMMFYAILQDDEQTLKWLEAAVNRGFVNYPFFNDHDPFLARLHGDPRFERLMQRVNAEWEEFEV